MPARAETLDWLQIDELPYTLVDSMLRELEKNVAGWAEKTMPPYVQAARLNFYEHMATEGTENEVPLHFQHQFMLDAGRQGLLGLEVIS